MWRRKLDRVAYLNMSDPMQSCPSAWRDHSANGVRVCGQQISGCQSTIYPAGNHSYSRVCGQVWTATLSPLMAHIVYVEGVSITHGSPRSHIWTFVAEISEAGTECPCEGDLSALAFVGDNYYCESEYNGTAW